MKTIEKFSDFTEETTLDGEKMRIDDIVNREIIITGYKITSSRFAKSNCQQCLKLQFDINGKKHILFTGSNVLIDQVNKYKEKIPFLATVIKIDKFYSFS